MSNDAFWTIAALGGITLLAAGMWLGSWIAGQKGRPPEEGALLSLFLGPFGLLVELLLPTLRPQPVYLVEAPAEKPAAAAPPAQPVSPAIAAPRKPASDWAGPDPYAAAPPPVPSAVGLPALVGTPELIAAAGPIRAARITEAEAFLDAYAANLAAQPGNAEGLRYAEAALRELRASTNAEWWATHANHSGEQLVRRIVKALRGRETAGAK